jgi:hypothetical protein
MGELDRKTSLAGACAQPFDINYDPANQPGPGSGNSMFFRVQEEVHELAVMATCCKGSGIGANQVSIVLTDPDGNKFSSGMSVPLPETPRREIVVDKPMPGRWTLEVCSAGSYCVAPLGVLAGSRAPERGPVTGVIVTRKTDGPSTR